MFAFLATVVAAQMTNAELEAMVKSLNSTMVAKDVEYQESFTHTWLLVCGALVLFMHAGFALLEAGMCREKNVESVLLKNLLTPLIGSVAWYLVGWTIAYGNVPEGGFAGSEEMAGKGFLVNEDGLLVPTMNDGTGASRALEWFFQGVFCCTASTIVSGGVAERVQIRGYVVLSSIMTGLIYPVVVAWTWSTTGWLNGVGAGYMDFAGSGIVHMTGGFGALAGAAIVGKRKGRFEGDQSDFDGHNLTYVVLGTLILWFGWYGFNCGSTLAMNSGAGKLAAQVAMNTTLGASFGGLSATLLTYVTSGKYDLVMTCGGILAGLVSITAGCGNVEPGSACFIASVGGVIFCGASTLLKKLKIDDPIDAFAVHGACGMWGVFAAALFDWGGFDSVHLWGGFEPSESTVGDALAANVTGIFAIMAWSGGLSSLVCFALRAAGWLRVDAEHEEKGLDTMEFRSPTAYRTSVQDGAPLDSIVKAVAAMPPAQI
jgi:Amt family ammonium transporter